MEQARAAALLFSSDASEQDRLAAVAMLRARGDLESRVPLLDGLSNQPPAVAAAAQLRRWPRSIACCNSGASLQSVYYGISLGSVLLLAAAGLAITFGVMGVINMAHGEMVMIGAYTTYRRAAGDARISARRCMRPACCSPCRWPSWSPAWSASRSSAA